MNLRLTISSIGVILGLAGLEHGIGEVLQGNITPKGFYIKSWPNSKLYEIVDGEPAFTIINNLFFAGIITIIISIFFMSWIVFLVESSFQKYNLYILFFFSVALLLSGGGVAPPIIGFIICPFIGRINTIDTNRDKNINLYNKVSKIWLVCYKIFVIAFLSLWPGLILLGLFIEITNPLIVVLLVIMSFSSLISALITATILDSKAKKIIQ